MLSLNNKRANPKQNILLISKLLYSNAFVFGLLWFYSVSLCYSLVDALLFDMKPHYQAENGWKSPVYSILDLTW